MAAGTTRIEDEKSRRAAEVAEKVSHIIQDEIRRFFRFCAISLEFRLRLYRRGKY